MRIIVAPDKFKGSLGAREVAENIAAGMRAALPEAEITILPIADGGEGTVAAICSDANGQSHVCEVHDAYGDLVSASFITCDGGETAILETSQAIGLWRVRPGDRGVTRASSYGAGELLLHAARSGVAKIIVDLGGSATNDGGFGLARALGFRFFDQAGTELVGPVRELLKLVRIEPPASLDLPAIVGAADVRNPLLGERGATRVFGWQKGGSSAELDLLESALARLAEVVARDLGVDHRDVPGAGAAGGLGYGLLSFAAATIRPGFDVVAECIGLEEAVRSADVVITGEGRLDAQTLEGKAPAGVARLARKYGKKVYAIVGEVASDAETAVALFDAVLSLARASVGRAAAIDGCQELLRERARELSAGLF